MKEILKFVVYENTRDVGLSRLQEAVLKTFAKLLMTSKEANVSFLAIWLAFQMLNVLLSSRTSFISIRNLRMKYGCVWMRGFRNFKVLNETFMASTMQTNWLIADLSVVQLASPIYYYCVLVEGSFEEEHGNRRKIGLAHSKFCRLTRH